MKILILCTGNSCRSQMAEGILNCINSKLFIRSAGTNPEAEVNKNAIEVMKEINIDISHNKPKNANEFTSIPWDYIITVCDDAYENCPVFHGDVGCKLHIGFEDPAKFIGNEVDKHNKFREVRDLIIVKFKEFNNSLL